MDIVGPETELLTRLMAASSLRQKVLAGNVANQNTPGYRRKMVVFESLVQDALDGGKSLAKVEPRVVVDELSPSSPDGNNVNLELEENAQDENMLLFEAYAAIMRHRFELLRSSIQMNGA